MACRFWPSVPTPGAGGVPPPPGDNTHSMAANMYAQKGARGKPQGQPDQWKACSQESMHAGVVASAMWDANRAALEAASASRNTQVVQSGGGAWNADEPLVEAVFQETSGDVPQVVLRELLRLGVLHLIPRNSEGRLLSAGSMLHSESSSGNSPPSCSPCSFWASSQTCKYSAACTFCHYEHKSTEDARQRMRPSKQMRLRLQRWGALLRRSRDVHGPPLEPLGEQGLMALLGNCLQDVITAARMQNTTHSQAQDVPPQVAPVQAYARDMMEMFALDAGGYHGVVPDRLVQGMHANNFGITGGSTSLSPCQLNDAAMDSSKFSTYCYGSPQGIVISRHSL
mmetsp:Transcript_40306/g.92691  ORF Transcript_40306/g.92691 Transcript_40306/m.92691 type:complete len:340 (+) Transcript_40306:96-1115(+)